MQKHLRRMAPIKSMNRDTCLGGASSFQSGPRVPPRKDFLAELLLQFCSRMSIVAMAGVTVASVC